jgi:hypothetical protein
MLARLFHRAKVKITPCKHKQLSITHPLEIGEYSVNRVELLGVTMSWGGNPVPLNRSHLTCHLCGEDFTRDAYLPSTLWHRDYPPDETGWPTLNGERIEIANL